MPSGGQPPINPTLRSGARLVDPNGTSHEIVEFRYKNQVNVGITWSATLGFPLNIQQFADHQTWTLRIADPLAGTTWNSPPLVVTHGSTTVGRGTQVSGIDYYSQMLTSTSATIPVFRNRDSWYIAAEIASYAGVGLLFNAGCPRCTVEQFPWFEEKAQVATVGTSKILLPGAKLVPNTETCGALISKLLHDTGCEFRINSTHVEALPMGYEQTLSRDPVIIRTELTVNRSVNFAQIILAKTGNSQTTYVFDATGAGVRTDATTDRLGQGLRYPRATPVPIRGKIGYAKFLDAAGDVCGYTRFQSDAPAVTVTSELPAVSVEWEPRAGSPDTWVRLRVDGLPEINATWIPNGAYTYGWTVVHPDEFPDLGVTMRAQQKIVQSPYWQNEEIAVAIREPLLRQYNKERNGVTLVCGLDPWPTFGLPCFRVPDDATKPAMRVESIEMNDGPGGRQMVLAGYVTTPDGGGGGGGEV